MAILHKCHVLEAARLSFNSRYLMRTSYLEESVFPIGKFSSDRFGNSSKPTLPIAKRWICHTEKISNVTVGLRCNRLPLLLKATPGRSYYTLSSVISLVMYSFIRSI